MDTKVKYHKKRHKYLIMMNWIKVLCLLIWCPPLISVVHLQLANKACAPQRERIQRQSSQTTLSCFALLSRFFGLDYELCLSPEYLSLRTPMRMKNKLGRQNPQCIKW